MRDWGAREVEVRSDHVSSQAGMGNRSSNQTITETGKPSECWQAIVFREAGNGRRLNKTTPDQFISVHGTSGHGYGLGSPRQLDAK